MSEGVKLKPCPFCGGEAYFEQRHMHGANVYYVGCANECPFMPNVKFFSDEQNAIATWNSRTPAPMTCVVTWVRYDGTEETLPEAGVAILLIRGGLLMRQSYSFNPIASEPLAIFGDIVSGLDAFCIGDLWAYLPAPPEVMG